MHEAAILNKANAKVELSLYNRRKDIFLIHIYYGNSLLNVYTLEICESQNSIFNR